MADRAGDSTEAARGWGTLAWRHVLPFPDDSFDVVSSFNRIWKGCKGALERRSACCSQTVSLTARLLP
jgi:hypothetical protein